MDKLIIVGQPVKFHAHHLSDRFEIERFQGGTIKWLELQQEDMAYLIFKAIKEAGLIHFQAEDQKDGSVVIFAALSVNKLQSVPRETSEQ